MSSDESVEYPSQHVVACEGCGSTVSVNWYCKNCPGSMCDSCKVAHKANGFTKKHLVVPRTGKVVRTYGPAKIAEECRIHTGKEIITYCNKCKVPCCISCQAEKHQQHEFSLIEDVYLSAEKRLNEYTKNLEGDVKPRLKNLIQQAKEEIAQSEQSVSDAEADVNEFRNELKQAVDDSCNAIMKSLRKPNDELNSFVHNVEVKLQNVDELVDHITGRVREGKLSLIEYIPPTPDTLIPRLTIPSRRRPRFIPNRNTLISLKNKIGAIQCEDAVEPEIGTEETSLLPNSEKSTISVEKITLFRSMIGVDGIALADNDKSWLVSNGSNTIRMYDKCGHQIKMLTVQGNCGINDVIVKPTGELIVSTSDKEVRLVHTIGTVTTLIDTRPFQPQGLSLTDKETIVVCMRGQGKKNHVAVYSSDGRKKLREIRAKNAQGEQLIANPYYVAVNCSDICVVNVDENVVCVDEGGDVRWVYDGKVAGLPKKFQPYGICKDKFLNLFVVDWGNHCVHYINREGHLIEVILQQKEVGIEDPVAIRVNDKTGELWLGNTLRNDVLVAKYFRK